ncbi:MAG: hypothetical protein KAX40_08330 [Herpetosiphon sp.]|nr:hypothetical protein [Herpetosiphon sp.]
MQFTGFVAPIKRVFSQHRSEIQLFGATVALLLGGEWCLRQAFQGIRVPDLEALQAAFLLPLGLLGCGLLGAALLLWVVLLARRQLSFFYPLWAISSVLGVFFNTITNLWDLSWRAWLGVVLVVLGAVLLMRGGHSL